MLQQDRTITDVTKEQTCSKFEGGEGSAARRVGLELNETNDAHYTCTQSFAPDTR